MFLCMAYNTLHIVIPAYLSMPFRDLKKILDYNTSMNMEQLFEFQNWGGGGVGRRGCIGRLKT